MSTDGWIKAADRAASLTRQMLAFSRRQAFQLSVFDLNALVEDMSSVVVHGTGSGGILELPVDVKLERL